MDEREAFGKIINVLTDHNLIQSKHYVIEYHKNGCFSIAFCPSQCVFLDIEYFYDMIPDIKFFKVKFCDHKGRKTMIVNIRIKLR